MATLAEGCELYRGVHGNRTEILCSSTKCFKPMRQCSSLELGLEFAC